MRFENASIALDPAWSSPFVRRQGPAAEASSLDVAAQVTERAPASARSTRRRARAGARSHRAARGDRPAPLDALEGLRPVQNGGVVQVD